MHPSLAKHLATVKHKESAPVSPLSGEQLSAGFLGDEDSEQFSDLDAVREFRLTSERMSESYDQRGLQASVLSSLEPMDVKLQGVVPHGAGPPSHDGDHGHDWHKPPHDDHKPQDDCDDKQHDDNPQDDQPYDDTYADDEPCDEPSLHPTESPATDDAANDDCDVVPSTHPSESPTSEPAIDDIASDDPTDDPVEQPSTRPSIGPTDDAYYYEPQGDDQVNTTRALSADELSLNPEPIEKSSDHVKPSPKEPPVTDSASELTIIPQVPACDSPVSLAAMDTNLVSVDCPCKRKPTYSPTTQPVQSVTNSPTADDCPCRRSKQPTYSPTTSPTYQPSYAPTQTPTQTPTNTPVAPSQSVTQTPSYNPAICPCARHAVGAPSLSAVDCPCKHHPTYSPTTQPVQSVTNSPTADDCPCRRSKQPTYSPTTSPTYQPSYAPTQTPTQIPTTTPVAPSQSVTQTPSFNPAICPCARHAVGAPSLSVVDCPCKHHPTSGPTTQPVAPSQSLTAVPSFNPAICPCARAAVGAPSLSAIGSRPVWAPNWLAPNFSPPTSPSQTHDLASFIAIESISAFRPIVPVFASTVSDSSSNQCPSNISNRPFFSFHPVCAIVPLHSVPGSHSPSYHRTEYDQQPSNHRPSKLSIRSKCSVFPVFPVFTVNTKQPIANSHTTPHERPWKHPL
eukprot:gene28737-35652_t